MKKILLMFMMCLSFTIANAQIATENSKLFDNTYVGVEVGATTPLNLNSVFPINPVAGVKVGKNITSVFGIEVEGLAVFGDNLYRYGIPALFNLHKNGCINTFVKATNVGVNGTINWSNLLFGYKGTPRFFEIKSNTGFGWLYHFGDNIIPTSKRNVLTAKTAVDLDFNLGNKKAHTITVSPGIYWGLNEYGNIKFNKNYAQLGVMIGYTYHFKTSNGTHAFKIYDVGAMQAEINRLNNELSKKPAEVVKYIVKHDAAIMTPNTYVVQFAQNSSTLSEDAKGVLDDVYGDVNIIASASPEGTKEYNQTLSEKRAEEVANYLKERGIKVNSYKGIGCENENSNRIAIITSF